MSRRPLAVWLYRALTRLLPGDLGRGYGDETRCLFEDLHADAVRERGALAGWILWARSSVLLLACAVRERDEVFRGRRRKGEGMMMGLLYDVRHGLRALAKRPGFSLTAILILGTGIGATTTIFSVVDAVVLRELPYPDAGRLVHFDNGAHSYPSFRAWQDMSSFEAVAAVRDEQVHLTGNGTPETLLTISVSPDFFRMFGGAPRLGRLFDAADHPGDRSVAILGHDFWVRRFGADPDVVGRALAIDEAPSVVVGVLEAGFEPPELNTGTRVDVWFPLSDGGENANDHGWQGLGVMARLTPSVSLEVAQSEVDAQRRSVAELAPVNYYDRDGALETTPLVALREATVQGVRGTLLTLLGAVALLLVIACANVANLFLAHGTARSRELALRAALGAGRGRIAAQVLTESVGVALAGGALGVALALGGVEAFARFDPGGVPRIESVAVDLRVLVFTVLVSTLTGLVFGTLPALQAMRTDLNEPLKNATGTATAGTRGRTLRSGLVVAEIALAVVLVTGAGLLLRSFVERARVDAGFDAENLLVVTLALEAGYDEPRRLQFADDLIERVAARPGIGGVAVGWTTPFKYTGRSRCCWRTRVQGDPTLMDEGDPFNGVSHPVTPGYFAALDAPMLSGREFNDDDGRASPAVAILNRPAARKLFGTEDVVGREIIHSGETLAVVGVVEGVHHWGATQGVEEAVYVPYARYGTEEGDFDLIVRSDADTGILAESVREAIWALDPELPIAHVTTMKGRVSGSLATPRFLSGLLGTFAAVALILACGGIYGSMLYMVGQRRREMGIRLALGAAGPDLVRLVLRHGAALVVGGVVAGTAVGLALSRTMESLLWGVPATDPLTFATVALLLGISAVAAAWVPAWRAGRTDPVRTLKAE